MTLPARIRAFCLAGLAGACVVVASVASAPAASTSTVISMTVPSTTSINATGCQSSQLGRTDFGIVQPGTVAVTTTDCELVFGSSNNSAALRVAQADAFGVAMYAEPRGSRDTAFGPFGAQAITFGSGGEYGHDVLVQPDGKLVGVGYASNGTNTDFAIFRRNADGTADTTFNTTGRRLVPIGAGADEAYAAALQADGKIVVVGMAYNGTNNDIAVLRLNADGSTDTTFNSTGIRITDGGSIDEAKAVAIQPDGAIVVAGHHGTGGDVAIMRYTPTGALDNTFNGSGRVTFSVSASGDYAADVALQPDGRIVVAGNAGVDWFVARVSAGGVLDGAFGTTSGRTVTDFTGGYDIGEAIVLQPDGKIVMAGLVQTGADQLFGLVRYTTGGVLDTTFGTGGRVVQAVSGGGGARDLLLLDDGRIVAAGYAYTSFFQDTWFLRVDSDGQPDPTFGTNGLAHGNFGGGDDYVHGMARDRSGRYVTIGRGGGMILGALAAPPIADYATATANLGTTGANAFGACLREVAGTGAAARWTPDATCPGSSGAFWNGIPQSASDSTARIASATTVGNDVTARLRFGVRTALSQPPGTYTARLRFEVVAPDVA